MNKVIEEIIKRSNDNIQFENGSPFTKEGFDTLKIEISSYINDLINESYKIAKRNRSGLISKSNIETAALKLIKKHSNNSKQNLTAIGAFLFGFAISKTFEVIADNQKFNTTNTLLLAACGVIGAFILGITLFKPRE